MKRKIMMEIGVPWNNAPKGHRRWIYREYLSVVDNTGSAEICGQMLMPGLASHNQGAVRKCLAG
jgi:hypothetical protein